MIKSYLKLLRQNKEKFSVPRTVQQTIPVDTIYKDGIFRIGNKYSKSHLFIYDALFKELVDVPGSVQRFSGKRLI